ncbi:nephrocystin-4 isoform X1 [Tachysurus ichikawai]
MGAEVPSVVVQERRLHVGVHNGLGWVDRPQLMVLEPSSEGSASLKQSSTETNSYVLTGDQPQPPVIYGKFTVQET